jgi:hypothetical protein
MPPTRGEANSSSSVCGLPASAPRRLVEGIDDRSGTGPGAIMTLRDLTNSSSAIADKYPDAALF